jgi:hypothetical protein
MVLFMGPGAITLLLDLDMAGYMVDSCIPVCLSAYYMLYWVLMLYWIKPITRYYKTLLCYT